MSVSTVTLLEALCDVRSIAKASTTEFVETYFLRVQVADTGAAIILRVRPVGASDYRPCHAIEPGGRIHMQGTSEVSVAPEGDIG